MVLGTTSASPIPWLLVGQLAADLGWAGGSGQRAGRGGGEILGAVGACDEQGPSVGAVSVDQGHCRNTGRGWMRMVSPMFEFRHRGGEIDVALP